MTSRPVLQEQVVWISPRATGFTVVCERCVDLAEPFPSVGGTLSIERARGTVVCRRGHELRVEREGR